MRSTSAPIAIVGMSCRFPGAEGLDAYWRLLHEGRDAVGDVPPDRFDIDAYFDPTPGTPGKIATRAGGFLANVDGFDDAFFRISPREAAGMDPQHRLALEVCYEALADAGVRIGAGESSVGLFLGIINSDYERLQYGQASEIDLYATTGSARHGAAGRVSYALGLEGPSMVVDTDRSSSLVATHLACQSLARGECRLALAGGTNLILSPELSIAFSRASMLSPEGRCKFGDAQANGFVRSEGVGFVVLKRLADAVRDGDAIYAVVRGSAMNNGGRASGDLMAPSVGAQQHVIEDAWASARLSMGQAVYIEAHGTGTPVGDRVELEALGASVGAAKRGKARLLVGSVKSNIGHTEAAAGVAGLIKAALSMAHGEIPASLHVATPNPQIAFSKLNVQLVRKRRPWPTGKKKLAGISSFGLTGTNAHVVLEEAPKSKKVAKTPAQNGQLLVLSARSEAALAATAKSFANLLHGPKAPGLADVCRSAAMRRTHHEHRLGVSAMDARDMAGKLESLLEGTRPRNLQTGAVIDGHPPRVAFVFPGNGGDWVGMADQLLRDEPVFRKAIRECDRAARPYLSWSLEKELRARAKNSRLRQSDVAQPVLTAMYIALTALWRSWGVHPDAVVGASVGEVAAAYVAGSLTLAQAMRVACTRARLISLWDGKGASAVISMPLAQMLELLRGVEDRVGVAGVNNPQSLVVSGEPDALDEVLATVERRGAFARRIKMDFAAHSPQMESVRAALAKELRGLRPRSGQLPQYSTVSGTQVRGQELGPEYWAANVRQAVQLWPTVEAMLRDGYDTFLEVSPHPIATTPLLEGFALTQSKARAFGTLRRDADARIEMLGAVGALYCAGYPVDWAKVMGRVGAWVRLPAYPWQHQPHWFATGTASPRQGAKRPVTLASDLAAQLRDALPGEQHELVLKFLERQVAAILGVDPSKRPDLSRPFRELGVTSLMALELRIAIGAAFGKEYPPTLLLDHPNIESLAKHLAGKEERRPTMLGQILLDCGLISDKQLHEALEEQDRSGGHERLGAVLVRSGTLTPDQLQRALLSQLREPIAVVGMACRFPGGATSPEAYWRVLSEGIDGISEIPAERWDVDAYYDPTPRTQGKMATRWGGFLADVDRFDADFFRIPPREAIHMDPQQRLLLETCWEALESGGQTTGALPERQTGVFVGLSWCDYYSLIGRVQDNPEGFDLYTATGNANSIAAGRLAYFLGVNGPAMAVDTACSSSLVAVHLACRSLLERESKVAIAAGVNVILTPETSVSFSTAGMLAPDGRCKTFDAAANGYVRSEGCGAVVLKRLSDAIDDGDPVLAVIRASAVNQDGASSGLTAPNRFAQEDVIRRALDQAQVEASAITYVEAHGTGTQLGDPIEMQALGAVLGEGRAADRPLVVGASKTHIGHTEAAAGIAGLIKTVLALQHEAIPANLHFKEPSPQIPWSTLPVMVPTKTIPWRRGGAPRLAGVSSFGMSGTNAHVILEEARVQPPSHVAEAKRAIRLLPVSAKTAAALRDQAGHYADHLDAHLDESLHDICYTASTRRSHEEHRVAVAGATRGELVDLLRAFATGEVRKGVTQGIAAQGQRRKMVFVFPGQGGQWVGMGKALLAEQPAFREAIEACAEGMRPHVDWSLVDVLAGKGPQAALDRVDVIQPAIFAMQVGLSALWRSWGVEPGAVVGHSMGEIAAAHVAGALSLEDACRVACLRSQLVRRVSGRGRMAVAELTTEQAREVLRGYEDKLSVGVVNSERSVVLSGDGAALEQVFARLEQDGVFCRWVKVDYASHSPQMDPLQPELRRLLQGIGAQRHNVPLYSTVTGQKSVEGFSTAYWERNLRETVQFAAALQALSADGFDTFLEVNPHPVLVPTIRDDLSATVSSLAVVASMHREDAGTCCLLDALGELYACGGFSDWSRVYPQGGVVASLPTYPFQRQRYWIETVTPKKATRAEGHPLLGTALNLSTQHETSVWETTLDLSVLPYLRDHQVDDVVILPGTAYVEMALSVGKQLWPQDPFVLEEVAFHHFLSFERDEPKTVQVVSTREGDDRAKVEISSLDVESGTWTLHTSVHLVRRAPQPETTDTLSLVRERCHESMDSASFYASLDDRGNNYGPCFQAVEQLSQGAGEALGHLVLPEAAGAASSYVAHPVLLDACLHLAFVSFMEGASANRPLVPLRIRSIKLYRPPGTGLWCHVQARRAEGQDGETFESDVRAFDENGALVVEALGMKLKSFRPATAQRNDWFLAHEWQAAPARLEPTGKPLGKVLLLSDGAGVGGTLKKKLEQRGVGVVLGDAASLTTSEAFEQLVSSEAFETIVHLWSLDGPPPSATTPAALTQARVRDCGGILNLVQAFARMKLRQSPRLVVVTRNVHAAGTNGTTLLPDAGVLWGLGRTVALEHPELKCARIDLASVQRDAEVNALVRELLGDRKDEAEEETSLRGDQRFVGRIVRRLPAASADAAGGAKARELVLRDDATYLVTGGLGGLGLSIASWMVDRGARHLVLVGRQGATTREQQAAVAKLEARGAKVTVAKADVARHADLEGVLAHVRSRHPELRGVVHAAGLLDPGRLVEQDLHRFARVMAPKVEGAWNLHVLTREAPLDFFVLYSSAASLFASEGQGSYAAANAFMDALAHHRRAQGLPALSINWGLFADVGLFSNDADGKALIEARGLHPLTQREGVEVLGRLLMGTETQMGVVPINVRRWVSYYPEAASSSLMSELVRGTTRARSEEVAAPALLSRLREEASPVERRRLLEQYVQEQAGEVLKMNPSEVLLTKSFQQLGFDSLMALNLRGRLESGLKLKLSATLVWKYPNVATLAEHLVQSATGPGEAPKAVEPQPARVATRSRSKEAPAEDSAALLEATLAEVEEFLR